MTSVYEYGPDSQRQPGVPQDTITAFQHVSAIFPDVSGIYLGLRAPARYDPASPAVVMVFQDGKRYLDEAGWFRACGSFRQPDPRWASFWGGHNYPC